MGQFLRFATLIILALTGFGSGVCGLLGVAYSLFDGGGSGGESFTLLVLAISAFGLLVAIGCFFAVRALARSLRAHTTPSAPPAPPPSA